MLAKDLMLTISVADWRPWHDGCMVRATARFSMLVKYHATSAQDDGEGWWNAQGFVAGISSWLTWRRIGASVKLSAVQPEVGPSYDRDGAWSGWVILWEDDIELPPASSTTSRTGGGHRAGAARRSVRGASPRSSTTTESSRI